jgi:ketosteroid isomerase-like protein
MTINRRQVAVAALASIGVSAFASLPAFAQAGDSAAVAEAVANLTKAMLAADKAKLEALVADQLSYGHSAGRLETKKEFVDVIAGKKTIYKSITLNDPTVSVAGNNAIARHTFVVETETDGKPSQAKVGVMQVWVKDGGSWKLLARQAFRTS